MICQRIILPESVVFSENCCRDFWKSKLRPLIFASIMRTSLLAHDQSYRRVTNFSNPIDNRLLYQADKQSLIGTCEAMGKKYSMLSISGSNVNINFYKAIDQEAGLDSILTALLIEGLQTDADGTPRS